MKSSLAVAIVLPLLAFSLGTSSAGETPSQIPQNVLLLQDLVTRGVSYHHPLSNPYLNSEHFLVQYSSFFPGYQLSAFQTMRPVLSCSLLKDPTEEPGSDGVNRQTLLINISCGKEIKTSVLGFIPQEYSSGLTTQTASQFEQVIEQNHRQLLDYPGDKVFTTNCVSFVLSQLYGKDFGGYWIASETSYDLFYKSGLFEPKPVKSFIKNSVSSGSINFSDLRVGDVFIWYDRAMKTRDFKPIVHVGIIGGFNNSGRPIVYNKYGQLPPVSGDIEDVTEDLTGDPNNRIGLDILRPVGLK